MKIINKKARFNYELLDRFEAGVVLSGPEVKSAKAGHVSLGESYARLLQGEMWLINATISPYQFADNKDYDPLRSRKLLLHKKELNKIAQQLETKKLTIVPTSLYQKKNRIKVEIALARGKKEFQKKEKIKERDLDRDAHRELKRFS